MSNAIVDKAKTYYDSNDADNFYFNIWGGEDIHVGIYRREGESIFEASRRTVETMASRLNGCVASSKVIDLGAGYGGSARYLAREKGFDVTCLNLSEVQNERNRRMNEEQGLAHKIDVVDGNFEALPFEDKSFNIAWSQDALLHSADRERVFAEVDRVLKPGGVFVLTDPMMREGASPELLQPVFDRIHLDSMGSVEKYEDYASALGWTVEPLEDRTRDLVTHYSHVLDELDARTAEVIEYCSHGYLERMKKGLRHWINAGQSDALFWGILMYSKAE
ncbi:methyltransferase domain-containing protein [Cerasicoccus frondis]|uniref:methyltransferase domain-containing protein n=1 Tax=Cerasicoccus frondis TaxID=490090 RepID=UPI002852DA41|nr:methyltransferase domain-containing protein [Cerasicoccus frondis]